MHPTEILNHAFPIGKRKLYAIFLNKTFYENYIIYLSIAYHTPVYKS